MNELKEKIETFLYKDVERKNISVVWDEGKIINKNSGTPYFYLDDIEREFGDIEGFLEYARKATTLKNKVKIKFNTAYTTKSGHKQQKVFIIYPFLDNENIEVQENEQESEQENENTETENMTPQPYVQTYTQPIVQPQYTSLGMIQVPQTELISSKVAESNYENLKREYGKIEEELKDIKSELRTTKEQLAQANIELKTKDKAHELDLKEQALNKKGIFESSGGQKLLEGLGAIIPNVASSFLTQGQSSPALGAPNLSKIKQAFVEFISQDEISDEAVTHMYKYITETLEEGESQGGHAEL